MMSTLLPKIMIGFGLALAASLYGAPSAFAADQPKPAKAKAPAKARQHAKAETVAGADGQDADVANATVTEYNCELGNKVTIFHDDKDDSHIALRWKKKIHRLDRIGTTTGARRFENRSYGLIWIGIPSKGMLLDSKLHRQLANECKNAEQSVPVAVGAAAARKG